MSAALAIAGLWVLFAVGHIGLSSRRLRPVLRARLGAQPFLGVYSLVALATFIPLVGLYFRHKHAGPWLWQLPAGPVRTWLVYLVMATAFVFLVSSFLRPSPAALGGGSAEVRGVYRLTRHPLVMAFALFGLAHLVPNGAASDLAFFGGFVGFAALGAWHQDRRKLAEADEAFQRFHAGTPFLPFTGRETLRGLRELSPLAVAIGVGLTLLVRSFHASWFSG